MKGARLPAPHIFVLHPFSFKTNIKSPKYAGNHFCPLYFQVVNCNPVCALRLSLWTITVAKKSATRDCWDDRHPPPSHLTCSFSLFFLCSCVFFWIEKIASLLQIEKFVCVLRIGGSVSFFGVFGFIWSVSLKSLWSEKLILNSLLWKN